MFSEKENVIHAGPRILHGRTNALGGKQAQAQTPGIGGSKFPKTPMRVPLKDENGAGGTRMPMTAKKSAVNLNVYNTPFVTPAGTRRLPLGGKDTNKNTVRRRTPLSGGHKGSKLQFPSLVNPSEGKVEVQTKVQPEDDDVSDVELVPPPVKGSQLQNSSQPLTHGSDLPYDCSDGWAPKYSNMTPYLFQNCMRYYMQHVDENGKTKLQREKEAAAEKFVQKEQEKAEAWFRGECPSPPFFPADSKKKRAPTSRTYDRPTGASLRGASTTRPATRSEKLSTVRSTVSSSRSTTRTTSSATPSANSSAARTATTSRTGLSSRAPVSSSRTPAPATSVSRSRQTAEARPVEDIKSKSTISRLQDDMAAYGSLDMDDYITELDLGGEQLDFNDNFDFEF